MSEFFYDQCCSVLVNSLVDIRHHTQSHKNFDDFRRFDSHTLRQLRDGDVFSDLYLTLHYLSGCIELMMLARRPRGRSLPAH